MVTLEELQGSRAQAGEFVDITTICCVFHKFETQIKSSKEKLFMRQT